MAQRNASRAGWCGASATWARAQAQEDPFCGELQRVKAPQSPRLSLTFANQRARAPRFLHRRRSSRRDCATERTRSSWTRSWSARQSPRQKQPYRERTSRPSPSNPTRPNTRQITMSKARFRLPRFRLKRVVSRPRNFLIIPGAFTAGPARTSWAGGSKHFRVSFLKTI